MQNSLVAWLCALMFLNGDFRSFERPADCMTRLRTRDFRFAGARCILQRQIRLPPKANAAF